MRIKSEVCSSTSAMEEAYKDLYTEFLQLRSLCLKQAALLGKLTEILRRQQAVPYMPNMDDGVNVSKPVQCTEKEHKSEVPSVPGLPQHLGGLPITSSAAGRGSSSSYPLAEGLNKLHLHAVESTDVRAVEVHNIATLVPIEGNIAPASGLADLLPAEQRLREDNNFDTFANHAGAQERKPPTQRRWMNSSFLTSELLSQAGGLLMSEVALQSQVCEFCLAVFPGNTTTIGDFLRHLNTHIT